MEAEGSGCGGDEADDGGVERAGHGARLMLLEPDELAEGRDRHRNLAMSATMFDIPLRRLVATHPTPSTTAAAASCS